MPRYKTDLVIYLVIVLTPWCIRSTTVKSVNPGVSSTTVNQGVSSALKSVNQGVSSALKSVNQGVSSALPNHVAPYKYQLYFDVHFQPDFIFYGSVSHSFYFLLFTS
jgi:hypothetical protein